MQLFRDQNGNIVDLTKIFTMYYTIKIVGENGVNEFYFVRNHQYTLVDTVERTVECEDIPPEYFGSLLPHYQVIINEENFYVPAVACVIEGTLRKSYRQDARINEYRLSRQPKNYIQAYLDATGIDLSKANQRQHNGFEQWLEEEGKKVESKTYGEVETDGEDSFEYKDLNGQ